MHFCYWLLLLVCVVRLSPNEKMSESHFKNLIKTIYGKKKEIKQLRVQRRTKNNIDHGESEIPKAKCSGYNEAITAKI